MAAKWVSKLSRFNVALFNSQYSMRAEKNFLRFLHYRVFDEFPVHRPFVQAILECYDRRRSQHGYMDINHHEINLEDEMVSQDTSHRLVLTARPDEFEKLPPKCSSCGVILQTTHNDASGFVPEQKFLDCIRNDTLHKLCCYHCYQLRYHNKPVINRLANSEVFDQLMHLRQRKALVLYVVDMFDIEGTMLRNILQLIGRHKRLIIVGNKIDKIPQDDKKPAKQLERMKDSLKEICYENGLEDCNFCDICLVSASTGYGLHTLVEKINKHRDVKMDVYLVGCTNVGKSTLYNLLGNLLNVHKKEELPAQAIEHHLPGTTVSLVRQSISVRRLQRLQKRLVTGPWEEEQGFEFDQGVLDLVGYKNDSSESKHKQLFLEENNRTLRQHTLEFVDQEGLKSEIKPCFIYDTPGILNESQIIQYLKSDEINYLSPQRWIVPRTFLLKPGNCIFIGGLARLDYIDIKRPKLETEDENIDGTGHVQNDENTDGAGHVEIDEHNNLLQSAESIYVTVMVSPNVPMHVTITETADEKYERLFVNNVLELPKGSQERFEEFPDLKSRVYTVVGKNRNINACDFVLHGVGWLSIAAVLESRVHLALHTPNGEGQGIREKPLLPYSVRQKEGRGVAYRGRITSTMYGHTRKRSPQFIRVFQNQNDPVYSWRSKIKQKIKQERFQVKEKRKLKRIEEGVVLGKMKALLEKEEKFKKLEAERKLQLQDKLS